MNITPKNPNIKISKLGEENTFVSGRKNWRLEWVEVANRLFNIGDTIKWYCTDERKSYVGKIEWFIIIEGGDIELSIDHPSLGRLDINEVKLIKKIK